MLLAFSKTKVLSFVDMMKQRTHARVPTARLLASQYMYLKRILKKAYSLIEPIVNSTTESANPVCPKCGSEDIEHIGRGKYATHLYMLSILFFLAGFGYLLASAEYNIKNVVMDWMALVMIVLFAVSGFIAGRKSKNCKCKHCGKRFDRI